MNLPISVILAEDDEDDRLFFTDALHELTIPTLLTTVNDGEQLMAFLNNAENELAQVLFLDINMPRKSGFDCLAEIKKSERLNALPVIIFSTSFDKEVVDQLHDLGANYYMRKPGGFLRLKEIIQRSLDLMITTGLDQPTKERFVLNVV
jgi:CheY-like chemotaxis protein